MLHVVWRVLLTFAACRLVDKIDFFTKKTYDITTDDTPSCMLHKTTTSIESLGDSTSLSIQLQSVFTPCSVKEVLARSMHNLIMYEAAISFILNACVFVHRPF